jgi:hypothetical protein
MVSLILPVNNDPAVGLVRHQMLFTSGVDNVPLGEESDFLKRDHIVAGKNGNKSL